MRYFNLRSIMTEQLTKLLGNGGISKDNFGGRSNTSIWASFVVDHNEDVPDELQLLFLKEFIKSGYAKLYASYIVSMFDPSVGDRMPAVDEISELIAKHLVLDSTRTFQDTGCKVTYEVELFWRVSMSSPMNDPMKVCIADVGIKHHTALAAPRYITLETLKSKHVQKEQR